MESAYPRDFTFNEAISFLNIAGNSVTGMLRDSLIGSFST